MKTSNKRNAAIAASAILAVILLLSCFTIVPVGSTGVIKTLGRVTDKTFGNGLHLKAPLIQSVVKVNNLIQIREIDADAVSKDLQAVSARIAVNYKVTPAASVGIVRTIGASVYEDTILVPAVQECVKSVTAKYTAEGMITERGKVSAEIAKTLEDKVSAYGIVVQEVNIVNFDFSEAFNKAIEEKQVAQQELIRVETEQKQLVVKAEAAAKAAEAQARAILVQAEAQAEANAKLAASLTSVLVEYEKIQKWDGVLPRVSGGSAIVDFRE